MEAHGFDTNSIPPDGSLEGMRLTTKAGRFAVLPGGGTVIERHAAVPKRSSLSEAKAAAAALKAVGGDSSLRLMAVLPALHAGRSAQGGGHVTEPEVFEHVVIYRQEIAGLPVLTPGVGEVRVHIDSAGKMRRLIDTRVVVLEVRDSGPSPVTLPTPAGGRVKARQLTTMEEVVEALRRASRHCDRGNGNGEVAELIPQSIAFGYALRGNFLVPVARGKVEFGKDRYRMFEAVEVDLIA